MSAWGGVDGYVDHGAAWNGVSRRRSRAQRSRRAKSRTVPGRARAGGDVPRVQDPVGYRRRAGHLRHAPATRRGRDRLRIRGQDRRAGRARRVDGAGTEGEGVQRTRSGSRERRDRGGVALYGLRISWQRCSRDTAGRGDRSQRRPRPGRHRTHRPAGWSPAPRSRAQRRAPPLHRLGW